MPQNKIIPFDYGDNLIRVVEDETTGEPLWVAKDVCNVLGYKNSRDATSKLDDDERGVSEIATPSGIQNMSCINESGLYTLILRSNKPEAKPFKRWVTHEVLPSIRKTGSYGVTDSSEVINQIVPVLNAMMEMMKQMVEMMQGIQERQMQQTQLLIEHKQESLTPSQLDEIKLGVNKVAKLSSDYHNWSWGRTCKDIYTELNGRLGVFSYYHINPADYDEAIELLGKWYINYEKLTAAKIQKEKEEELTRYEMPQF